MFLFSLFSVSLSLLNKVKTKRRATYEQKIISAFQIITTAEVVFIDIVVNKHLLITMSDLTLYCTDCYPQTTIPAKLWLVLGMKERKGKRTSICGSAFITGVIGVVIVFNFPDPRRG